MTDSDGTSLYPLIYPSRLGPLDMLSSPLEPLAPLLPATGDEKGSLVLHSPCSLPISFASRLVGDEADGMAGTPEPDADCERMIALGGSFRRPEGEDV
jgi:hypothetical protein